jgi:hypothetical protein
MTERPVSVASVGSHVARAAERQTVPGRQWNARTQGLLKGSKDCSLAACAIFATFVQSMAAGPMYRDQSAIPRRAEKPNCRCDQAVLERLATARRTAEWPAPQKLVHPKWESPGRVSPGGGVSQRRICRVMGRSRSGLRYRRKRRPDEPALNWENILVSAWCCTRLTR